MARSWAENGVYPHPPAYVESSLYGEIRCKIPFSKSLDTKILETKDFGSRGVSLANRHGLDNDCAREGLRTRLDVTGGLWKFLSGLLFEMSSLWSILWSRFHIWKSFKSCWIRSCYTPPTEPRRARSETVPL